MRYMLEGIQLNRRCPYGQAHWDKHISAIQHLVLDHTQQYLSLLDALPMRVTHPNSSSLCPSSANGCNPFYELHCWLLYDHKVPGHTLRIFQKLQSMTSHMMENIVPDHNIHRVLGIQPSINQLWHTLDDLEGLANRAFRGFSVILCEGLPACQKTVHRFSVTMQ